MNAPDTLLQETVEPILGWAVKELVAQGITVTGPGEERRRRDWTLLTLLPTDAGPVWVKACARAFAHEGPLLQTLDRLAPGSVLKPLAVHRENGWLISPDGGATKSRGPADRGLFPIDGVDVAPGRPAGWDEVMRSYAALQQRLSDHVAELRETGTPYLPPERLIDVYRHYENQAPGLGPAIERTAAELARYQRLTLEHNDLFPGHVFATGGYLFDWGDAVITHPFLSARTLADPQREQYFDAWRAVSTVTDTETALAERLAPLTALAPFRTIDMSPGAPAAHFAPFIAELVDQLRRNLT